VNNYLTQRGGSFLKPSTVLESDTANLRLAPDSPQMMSKYNRIDGTDVDLERRWF
tara:strand:- start:140 stop:304 length:165 start_codon:yes stop_codon:yes gene_type:complete